MHKVNRVIPTLAVLALLTMGVAACGGSSGKPSIGNQSATAAQQRAQAFSQASKLYPQPIPKNFPLRKALVDLTVAQDEINHPWYVYIQGQGTGQVIGYYVAKTAPQSVCNTLSNTQAVTSDPNADQGSLILTSPSLNGYYAGGAGASGSCTTYFFEDETTGAIVEVNSDAYFTSNQPLALNVPRIRVEVGKG